MNGFTSLNCVRTYDILLVFISLYIMTTSVFFWQGANRLTDGVSPCISVFYWKMSGQRGDEVGKAKASSGL